MTTASSKSKTKSSFFTFPWSKKKTESKPAVAAAASSAKPSKKTKAAKENPAPRSGFSFFSSLFGGKKQKPEEKSEGKKEKSKKDEKKEKSNHKENKKEKDHKKEKEVVVSKVKQEVPVAVEKRPLPSPVPSVPHGPTSNNTSPTDLQVSSNSNDAVERPPIVSILKQSSIRDANPLAAVSAAPAATKKKHRRELSLDGIGAKAKLQPVEDPRISLYMRKDNISTDVEDSLPPTPQRSLSKSTSSHGKGHRRTQSHNLNSSMEGISFNPRDMVPVPHSSSNHSSHSQLHSKSGSRTTVDRLSSSSMHSLSGSFHGSLHTRTLTPTQVIPSLLPHS
jgi:hypothetical protein